jgi:hypothetical protein
MVPVRALLASALMLFGCPEKIGVGVEDTGRAQPDGGALDARDADSDEDGGSIDATPADASEDGDASIPETPLRFGMMSVPADQISLTTIWGRSTNEMFAGTGNGNVLAFSPGSGWQNAWHEPSNFGIVRIRGTAQQIFVASTGALHVHGPGIGEDVRSFGVGSWVYDLEVVSDDEAYLVADINNGRAVFAWDGAGVSVLEDQLDAAVLYGVFVDEDGTLFVAANGKIFRYASFTWIEDPIDWPSDFGIADIANFDLYDVARVGSELVAVGDDHHVLRWNGSAWSFVYEPHHGEYLSSVGALSGTEAYAVGRSGAGGPIARFAGGVWMHVDYQENHNFRDLWIAGPNELYAAGVVGSTFEPVLLRGFR